MELFFWKYNEAFLNSLMSIMNTTFRRAFSYTKRSVHWKNTIPRSDSYISRVDIDNEHHFSSSLSVRETVRPLEEHKSMLCHQKRKIPHLDPSLSSLSLISVTKPWMFTKETNSKIKIKIKETLVKGGKFLQQIAEKSFKSQ